MATTELASIVSSYLRKHGFVKTLSAFLRENDDSFQETDIVDLETLYQLYSSTQANGVNKVKESKRSKSKDGHVVSEGEKVVRDHTEKASDSLHMNGGISSEKKKKKGDKKNASFDLPELDQTRKSAAEGKNIKKEEGSKKKKGGENLEGNDTKMDGLKPECERSFVRLPGMEKQSLKEAYSNGNATPGNSTLKESLVENNAIDDVGLKTQQEPAHLQKSSSKKKEKERKKQEGALLEADEESAPQETKAADEAQVLSQDCDPPKKKRKKLKNAGSNEETEDGAVVNPASKVASAEHTEKLDASIQTTNKVEGGEFSAKRKKHKRELSSLGAEDCLKEPLELKLEGSKEDDTHNKKQSAKKRKVKENTAVEGDSIQDVEATADMDAQMHESGSAKTKQKKETPNDKKTPTGALAFKRVEVEKVKFTDPRLSDNSYWAKDGAEEGYGAKAQEVLGSVRGRDFRHEKTKKKRGSYRGGFIGLDSHSIKFENSDED